MFYQGNSTVPVREAVLHCAAIKAGQFDGLSAFQIFSIIDQWHKGRGLHGFGYHGIFMPDGQFYPGRPLTKEGAHVLGHNKNTWGFLLIETAQITKIGAFEDYFTPAQGRALRAWLRSQPQIIKVSGHNDYDNKLCPGFRVQSADWIA